MPAASASRPYRRPASAGFGAGVAWARVACRRPASAPARPRRSGGGDCGNCTPSRHCVPLKHRCSDTGRRMEKQLTRCQRAAQPNTNSLLPSAAGHVRQGRPVPSPGGGRGRRVRGGHRPSCGRGMRGRSVGDGRGWVPATPRRPAPRLPACLARPRRHPVWPAAPVAEPPADRNCSGIGGRGRRMPAGARRYRGGRLRPARGSLGRPG